MYVSAHTVYLYAHIVSLHIHTYLCINMHTHVPHTHGINKGVGCGNRSQRTWQKNSSTSSNIACVQYINKFAPRSASSWVAWRAVASLAALWSCLLVETINCWVARRAASSNRKASIHVGSILGTSWQANLRVMLANKPYHTVWLRGLNSVEWRPHLEWTPRKLSRAKRGLRWRPSQCLCELTLLFARWGKTAVGAVVLCLLNL